MMQYKITLIKLNRGSDILPPSKGKRTEGNSISKLWKEIPEELRTEVFKPRSRDFDIEAVAFLITELDDVVIYSSNYDRDTDKFGSMYVAAKQNVVEIKELKTANSIDFVFHGVTKKIEIPTKPVLITWLDAISNHTAGTPEEIMEKSKITPIYFAGFLIGIANDALYVATAYNKEVNKYRGILIIPLMNVVSVELLV